MSKNNNIKSNYAVEFLRNNGVDNMLKNSDYVTTTEESNDGWFFDYTGIYVPYTHKNEKYYDPRNIYLKISRQVEKEPKLVYTWGKVEDQLFYPMETCWSSELICDNDKTLTRGISYAGKRCNLNSGKGVYKNFIKDIKDKINDFDGLTVLKEEDYDFLKITPFDNFTVDLNVNNHNFMDMRELCKLALGMEPAYSYPERGYDMFLCPFHNDHKPSAHVFKHTLQCFKHTQRQFDQTEFLKWLFYLNTVSEVEVKFQELLQ